MAPNDSWIGGHSPRYRNRSGTCSENSAPLPGSLGHPSPMEVRAASVDDAEAVAAVHVRSWQAPYRGLIPDAHLDTLFDRQRVEIWSRILAEADLPRTGAFVLQDGLEVIGFIHVAPTRDDDLPASTGEVTGLYVAPSAWGLGGGRQLLDTAKPASGPPASWQAHCGYSKPISLLDGSTNAKAGSPTGRARSTTEVTWCSWRFATLRLSSWGRAGARCTVTLRRADRPASGRTRPSRSARGPQRPVAGSATG